MIGVEEAHNCTVHETSFTIFSSLKLMIIIIDIILIDNEDNDAMTDDEWMIKNNF